MSDATAHQKKALRVTRMGTSIQVSWKNMLLMMERTICESSLLRASWARPFHFSVHAKNCG